MLCQMCVTTDFDGSCSCFAISSPTRTYAIAVPMAVWRVGRAALRPRIGVTAQRASAPRGRPRAQRASATGLSASSFERFSAAVSRQSGEKSWKKLEERTVNARFKSLTLLLTYTDFISGTGVTFSVHLRPPFAVLILDLSRFRRIRSRPSSVPPRHSVGT